MGVVMGVVERGRGEEEDGGSGGGGCVRLTRVQES